MYKEIDYYDNSIFSQLINCDDMILSSCLYGIVNSTYINENCISIEINNNIFRFQSNMALNYVGYSIFSISGLIEGDILIDYSITKNKIILTFDDKVLEITSESDISLSSFRYNDYFNMKKPYLLNKIEGLGFNVTVNFESYFYGANIVLVGHGNIIYLYALYDGYYIVNLPFMKMRYLCDREYELMECLSSFVL